MADSEQANKPKQRKSAFWQAMQALQLIDMFIKIA